MVSNVQDEHEPQEEPSVTLLGNVEETQQATQEEQSPTLQADVTEITEEAADVELVGTVSTGTIFT